jgi:hypothetical protein
MAIVQVELKSLTRDGMEWVASYIVIIACKGERNNEVGMGMGMGFHFMLCLLSLRW